MMVKPPPKKRLVFGIIFAILLYVLMEAVAWAYYLIRENEFFSMSHHQRARAAIVRGVSQGELPSGFIPVASIESEVIHPYLGFVIDPRESKGYSEHGFLGNAPLFSRQAKESLIVGVFGGSFAGQTLQFGADEMLLRLKRDPRFADREITLQSFALGGYKQPQQLLALTYFLSLGAQLDVVVNLDGFNEVTLAAAENAGLVNPFYPRGWPARIGNPFDPANLKLAGRLVTIDDRIVAWARAMSWAPLRYNITANLIWRYRHVSLYNRRANLAARLMNRVSESQQNSRYVITGPAVHYESEDEMFEDLARVWMLASLQMHHLCAENGIEYFHFLQPNQYLRGSKPLSRKELALAFDDDHPYRPGVQRGYPLLIENGNRLRELGVNFTDLTRVFFGTRETLYSDTCCHLTADGYEIVAAEIGDVIRDQMGGGDSLDAVGTRSR